MYSIKKVSELTRIPIVTIRAWENRYQIITPVRSNGGHRLYSEADVEKLLWIKDQMETKKLKISEAVFQLKSLAAEEPAEQRRGPDTGTSFQELGERLYGELVMLNSAQAHQTIDFAFSLYHYEDVFHHILGPVLHRIGDAWESGLITVAHEHFATQLVTERFNQFHRTLPIQPQLPIAVSFCPEGEHHHMGLMLFSLFLRKKGMDVIYLGPNTPLAGLSQLIRMKRILVAAISVSDSRLLGKLEEWIEACRVDNPLLTFVLGGRGLAHCPDTLAAYVQAGNPANWENWFRAVIAPLRRLSNP